MDGRIKIKNNHPPNPKVPSLGIVLYIQAAHVTPVLLSSLLGPQGRGRRAAEGRPTHRRHLGNGQGQRPLHVRGRGQVQGAHGQ